MPTLKAIRGIFYILYYKWLWLIMALVCMALVCILDHPAQGIHTETCTECPPTVSNKKDQLSEGPTEATEIGNLFTK